MEEIVSKFLLAGDKFMPEMHWRKTAALGKTGFTYSACGPFTRNKEYKNLKKQETHNIFIKTNHNHVQNIWDKL